MIELYRPKISYPPPYSPVPSNTSTEQPDDYDTSILLSPKMKETLFDSRPGPFTTPGTNEKYLVPPAQEYDRTGLQVMKSAQEGGNIGETPVTQRAVSGYYVTPTAVSSPQSTRNSRG